MAILLCAITRSADTLRISTQEYVDGSGNAYRGDILEDVDIVKELPDVFYGVEKTSGVTLRLSNIDNGVDDPWQTIFDAEELRGCTAVLSTSDGVTLLTGIVSEYSIATECSITIVERDESFNALYPTALVTTDLFTNTAADIGLPIPIVFGYAKNVPLPCIQNYTPATSTTTDTDSSGVLLIDATAAFSASDVGKYAQNVTTGKTALILSCDSGTQLTVDTDIFNHTGDTYGVRCFDYLLGAGPIEGLWIDHANGRGVRRNGALVPEAEYTVDDRSGDSSTTDHGYAGYATIRFAREQVDFTGQRYTITADIKGLLLGGSIANRNFATCIKNLINHATLGLNKPVNALSFTLIAAVLSTTYWKCDFGIFEQRQARDVLNDMLFACKSRLRLNSSGEWTIATDTAASSSASFGDNDGYLNNCDVISCGVMPAEESIKTGYVVYDNKQISLACHTAFGEDRTFEVPCVIEDVTAKKILSYLYGRSVYADKKLTLISGADAASVSIGDVVTVTAPARGITAQLYRVVRTTRRLISTTLDCELYSESIFSDQTIADPTALEETSTATSALKTIEDATIIYVNYPEIDQTKTDVVGETRVINGVLYHCTVAGTPGTWEPLGGALKTNRAVFFFDDTNVTIEESGWYRWSLVGPAGSGARASAGASSGAGGGAFCEKTKYMTVGDVVTINLGSPGAAPAGDNTNGNDGWDSTLVCAARDISMTAGGGKKGTYTTTNGVTKTGGLGGVATGGDINYDGGKGGDAQHLTGGIEQGGGGAAGSPAGPGGDGGDAIAASTAIIAAGGGGAIGDKKGGNATATGDNGAGAGTGSAASGTTAGTNKFGIASVKSIDGVDRSASMSIESYSDPLRALTGGGATTTNNSGPGAGGPAYVNADSGTGRAGILGGSGGGREAGTPGFGGGSGGCKLTGKAGGKSFAVMERVG
jgi:uncharacterized protein (UPF0218 family)